MALLLTEVEDANWAEFNSALPTYGPESSYQLAGNPMIICGGALSEGGQGEKPSTPRWRRNLTGGEGAVDIRPSNREVVYDPSRLGEDVEIYGEPLNEGL